MHLITDLDVGGAEMMLAKLAEAFDRARFRTVVVSLMPPGLLGQRLSAAGIAVRSLGMARGVPDPRGLTRLVSLLRREPVDLLQSWLYHADLLGVVAARLAGVSRLCWNIRCTAMDPARYSRISAALPRLLARLSASPDAVLVNSAAAQRAHEELGYHPKRWAMIPNGFDVARFQPDIAAGPRRRRDLGLPGDAFLIGLPARFDPMKDHATFLAAAALFAARCGVARFLLMGRGVARGNTALERMIAARGLGERVLLLGERADMAELLPGLDVATLSSAFGESFPNVVGEAMACGVPVAATAVGDVGEIVGATGIVVPPGDAAALAGAWQRLYEAGETERRRRGAAARQRVVSNYALPAIARRYETLYEDIVSRGR
jgi:glycosyltransferase involved in cell wall biosynthesis